MAQRFTPKTTQAIELLEKLIEDIKKLDDSNKFDFNGNINTPVIEDFDTDSPFATVTKHTGEIIYNLNISWHNPIIREQDV